MLGAFRHSLCSSTLIRTASHSWCAYTNALLGGAGPSQFISCQTSSFSTSVRKPSGYLKTTAAASSSHSIVNYPHITSYGQDKAVPVYDLSKEVVDNYTLNGAVFNVPVRIDILHRVVRWQRAKRQQGTHSVKDRSEVRGGGRKPRPQKGSGRSRQGSIRAPQWRGGGICHGPVPRSHAHSLPKKVRRMGLMCALSAKAHEQRLLIVDSMQPSDVKTRLVQQHLDMLLQDAPRQSVLLVDESMDSAEGGAELRLAARNLQGVEVVPAIGANVYSILKRDYLIMTTAAADLVTQRLLAPINRMGMCRPAPTKAASEAA
jgi:large subunit ribosomal protein L4